MTILKGYTCVTLLLVPKAFQNGGYLFSPLILLASFFVTTQCALKLVQAGLQQGVYSYSQIVLNALGPRHRCLIDVMIMLTEFSLTLSYMVFIIESLGSVIQQYSSVQVNPFYIAGGLVCVLTPIAWV
jgi:proton-coupled amino acid transporter